MVKADVISGDWHAWGNHILTELKRNSEAIHRLTEAIQTQRLEQDRELASIRAGFAKELAEAKADFAKELADVKGESRETKTRVAFVTAGIATAISAAVTIAGAILKYAFS